MDEWEQKIESAFEFLGFTRPPSGVIGQVTRCSDCHVEGMKIEKRKIRKWYHFFIPELWHYYGVIDEDPYCDTYRCQKCERIWRTPKIEYCNKEVADDLL